MSVPGFPNFFVMYGPNTNLGHNSILFMLECQANYIVRCLQAIERRGLRYLDLKPEVMRKWSERLQAELSRTPAGESISQTDCSKVPRPVYRQTDSGPKRSAVSRILRAAMSRASSQLARLKVRSPRGPAPS